MSVVLTFAEPRVIGFREAEDLPLQAQEIRLQTLYSGISAGTELTAYRGSNPYLRKHWDVTRRLFVEDAVTSLQYPVEGWGYEECGRVVETGSGVTQVHMGDVVYGTWGHRTHTVVSEEYAASRLLPAKLDPLLGIFSRSARLRSTACTMPPSASARRWPCLACAHRVRSLRSWQRNRVRPLSASTCAHCVCAWPANLVR